MTLITPLRNSASVSRGGPAGRQPDMGATYLLLMGRFGAQRGPASQSEITYGFPARKICVRDRRVDEFWNA
jgi:hypothetical protein